MASSHLQNTVLLRASGSHESPCSNANDMAHHGLGQHSLLPPHQYEEDSFTRASDFEPFAPQFSFSPSNSVSLWDAEVVGPPTLYYYPSSFPDNDPASPTSSVTPPPFPTTPFSLPNADQYISGSSRSFAIPTEGFPSQECIHQEQLSVYGAPSSIWNKNYLGLGQMTTFHDPAHRYTFCFGSPSPDNCMAEDTLSWTAKTIIVPPPVISPFDTPPVSSKRARTPSDLSDEPQPKRIQRDPNPPIDIPADPAPTVMHRVASHPHPSTLTNPPLPPPMEGIEEVREFRKGNRCGHRGCGKWHTDTSVVSRHRRAHVDRYPCPNPDCVVITTTYRALQRHWANPKGGCSTYKRRREECLMRGQVDVETFDPKVHQPYKSLKLQHGKHVN